MPSALRASAAAAGLALLLVALAPPAQAFPLSPVLLTVSSQGGAALLEWELAPAIPPPAIDVWVITRVADDGQSTDIVVPGYEVSYVDTDVVSGRLYVYTVTYVEQGVSGLPSNPALFSVDCFLIFKCNPLHAFPENLDCLLVPCFP